MIDQRPRGFRGPSIGTLWSQLSARDGRPNTSNSAPISTLSSIKTLRRGTGSNNSPYLIDTSVAVELGVVDPTATFREVAISALTLGELEAGLHASVDDMTRARRRNHLRHLKEKVTVLTFDEDCAHAYGHVYAAVERVGRKPRGPRMVDLMIAATALAHQRPFLTRNARDLRGLDELIEIVDVGAAR